MGHPFDITALENFLEGTSLSADILNRLNDLEEWRRSYAGKITDRVAHLERSVGSTDYADSPITRSLAESIDDRMLKLVAEINGNFSALEGRIDHTDRHTCGELDRLEEMVTKVDQKQIRYTDTLRREGDDMRRRAERIESRLDALEASQWRFATIPGLEDLGARVDALEARLATPEGMPDEIVAEDPKPGTQGVSRLRRAVASDYEENTILGTNPSFFSPAITVTETEGPILKDFVNWLTTYYFVFSGGDAYQVSYHKGDPQQYDTPADKLIGEYLVSRGKKG